MALRNVFSQLNPTCYLLLHIIQQCAIECKYLKLERLAAFIFTLVRMMIQAYLLRCDIPYLVWKRRNKLTRANGKESKNECIDIKSRQTCVIRETCSSEMQRFHLRGKSNAYGTGFERKLYGYGTRLHCLDQSRRCVNVPVPLSTCITPFSNFFTFF